MKIVQIRSFFWSERREIRTRKNSVFGHFSRSEYYWNIFYKFGMMQKMIIKLKKFVLGRHTVARFEFVSCSSVYNNILFAWLILLRPYTRSSHAVIDCMPGNFAKYVNPAFNKGNEISFNLALIRTNATAYTTPKHGVNTTMAMVKP